MTRVTSEIDTAALVDITQWKTDLIIVNGNLTTRRYRDKTYAAQCFFHMQVPLEMDLNCFEITHFLIGVTGKAVTDPKTGSGPVSLIV